MRVIIEPDYQSLSNWAANYVANKINAAKTSNTIPNAFFFIFLPHVS